MFNNTAFLLDFRSSETEKDINLTVNLPPTAVPGSEKVFISAIADPIAVAMNNLMDLLHYPTGCGEQVGLNNPTRVHDRNHHPA